MTIAAIAAVKLHNLPALHTHCLDKFRSEGALTRHAQPACRLHPLRVGGHGAPHAPACRLHAAATEAGTARPTRMPLRPLRRRWTQRAPPACQLHGAAPPSTPADTARPTCMPTACRCTPGTPCVGGGNCAVPYVAVTSPETLIAKAISLCASSVSRL